MIHDTKMSFRADALQAAIAASQAHTGLGCVVLLRISHCCYATSVHTAVDAAVVRHVLCSR